MEIMTGGGVARVELDGDSTAARFLLLLTHGAGGGVETPDLLAARDAGLRLGGMVARVIQPYRARGARAPGSVIRQDGAWIELVGTLRSAMPDVSLIQGGRSNGARVACRTAAAVRARAVVALAFPLRPPGRAGAAAQTRMAQARVAQTRVAQTRVAQARVAQTRVAQTRVAQTRVAELRAARAAGAMVLVVNGDRDPFGVPDAQDADRVVIVPGETHALKGHREVITDAVAEWLSAVL